MTEGSMVTKTKMATSAIWTCAAGVKECRVAEHVEGAGVEELLLFVGILFQNEAVLEEARVTFYIRE